MPAGLTLAPDRLPQGERSVQRGGWIEREEVARQGATVVIQNHGQPGLGRGLPLAEHEDIQETVVGLPDGIGGLGFATMQKIEALAVGF